MNRIVREHYPASKLPAELREGIDKFALVTVTIQEEMSDQEPLSRERLRALIEDAQKDAKPGSIEDAVARVREMRDEWDD